MISLKKRWHKGAIIDNRVQMKYIITIIILSIHLECYCQTNLLSKYSYPVFTITNGQAHNGSAFLYKKKNKVFVITNLHIRGVDPFKYSIEFDADTLYFKYCTSDTFGISRLAINKTGENALKIFKIDEQLDLYSIELVPIPINASLHYINDFIDNSFFDKIPDSIIVFGYPVNFEKKD